MKPLVQTNNGGLRQSGATEHGRMSRRVPPLLLVSVFLSFTCGHPVSGQIYSMRTSAITAASGPGSAGPYVVNASLGQFASAARLAEPPYEIAGRFCFQESSSVLPDPPRLELLLSSTNTIIVSWPSAAAGWELQSSPELRAANWTATAQAVMDDGLEKYVIIDAGAAQQFYRLFRP